LKRRFVPLAIGEIGKRQLSLSFVEKKMLCVKRRGRERERDWHEIGK